LAATKPSGETAFLLPDLTIDEVYRMLKDCGMQYPDRVLDAAFAKGDPAQGGLPLWEGLAIVPPHFFATELGVNVTVDGATGRPHAEINAIRWSLDPGSGPGGSYVWRTSAKAVSNFIKGLPGAAKHPGGRTRLYSHEKVLIAAAVYLQVRGKSRPPGSTELKAAVATMLGDQSPEDSHLADILRPLCAELGKDLDPEMLASLKLIGGRRKN
jgi:hypothetical protein